MQVLTHVHIYNFASPGSASWPVFKRHLSQTQQEHITKNIHLVHSLSCSQFLQSETFCEVSRLWRVTRYMFHTCFSTRVRRPAAFKACIFVVSVGAVLFKHDGARKGRVRVRLRATGVTPAGTVPTSPAAAELRVNARTPCQKGFPQTLSCTHPFSLHPKDKRAVQASLSGTQSL